MKKSPSRKEARHGRKVNRKAAGRAQAANTERFMAKCKRVGIDFSLVTLTTRKAKALGLKVPSEREGFANPGKWLEFAQDVAKKWIAKGVADFHVQQAKRARKWGHTYA